MSHGRGQNHASEKVVGLIIHCLIPLLRRICQTTDVQNEQTEYLARLK